VGRSNIAVPSMPYLGGKNDKTKKLEKHKTPALENNHELV
jgi:hypothetical protein